VLTVTSGTSKPMRHRRVITALLVCVTAVPVLAASQADSSSPRQRVSKGCPGRFAGPAVRPTSLGSVVAVARLVAIDHITSHYQGRSVRRNVVNYPVLEVLELSTGPILPGQQTLRRRAARRCGDRAARSAWAVIFTDSESPICCTEDVRFVIHLKDGWWVF